MKILYIDCGGTKTAGYLVDDYSSIIDRCMTGPGNINSDYLQASNNIWNNIKHFNNSFDFIEIGVAGYSNYINREKLFILLSKKLNSNNFRIYSDLELLAKLTIKEDKNSLLINLGTGTAAIRYINNKYQLILGWGKLINDIGSGYDITINAIKYFCEIEDKNIKDVYYDDFLKKYNLSSIRELIPKLNLNTILNYSEWVNNLNEKGINKFVIPRVKKVLDYLNFIEPKTIYCSGSVFTKNPLVQEFTTNYYKDSQIKFIDFEKALLTK